MRCDDLHDGEVYARILLSENNFPGQNELDRMGSEECAAASEEFLDHDSNYPPLDIHFLFPKDSGWQGHVRWITCIYMSPAGVIRKPVLQNGTPYTVEQKRYAVTVQSYNREFPKFQALRGQWTERSEKAGAMQQIVWWEVLELTSAPWSPEMQPLINDWVAKKRAELVDWTEAAAAGDAKQLEEALANQAQDNGLAEEKKVRDALRFTRN
ncbi:Septum formation [Amycolatopsis xylanica]|uniref:Septum formation n=1 Tax=Amycolatopsis xylanica TaxID=589385 RepID=A0A1H3N700_9PSEU|nr:Septum formation [Amycolatopsis xylanica]